MPIQFRGTFSSSPAQPRTPAAPIVQTKLVATSSQSWIVPAGVFFAMFEAWGAGGGGSGGYPSTSTSPGAGGGGGGYSSTTISVIPTATYSLVVGIGGPGGTVSNPGTDGNDSYAQLIGIDQIRSGGGAGATVGAPPAGGAGGSGDVAGSAGGTPISSTVGGPGGAAGQPNGGSGGSGHDATAPGNPGNTPGGGGGGGGMVKTTRTGSSGGNGADGQVTVTW